MRQARLLLSIAVLCVGRPAWPQGMPLGPEFRVNSYTTDYQSSATVASDSSGNFVVVWDSYGQVGAGRGVFGQRYDSSGAPLGPEFRVNTSTTSSQSRPWVAAAASGSFVVVWQGDEDGSLSGISGQRYDGSGTPLGGEFRVNTYTTGGQARPAVAADSSGNFVAVWQSYGQDGANYGVFGQRYDGAGAPLGPEFLVNTYTTTDQFEPRIAADPSGNFVVVWDSYTQDGAEGGVHGQRFAGSGLPLGPEFRVNTYTTGHQGYPAVAVATGAFVVVWDSFMQDGAFGGIFGQRYDSAGAPLGPEFLINTHTTGSQIQASVAADSSGNFVVTWGGYLTDESMFEVFGQRFASSGTPLGPEFQVNSYTTATQGLTSVAADPSGSFVVVWSSYGQDGSSSGVFGQRYAEIVPVELMRFGVE